MKRLLCIISAMNAGGAETFLMKVYRNIDRTSFQMDFCVNTEKNLYEREIEKLGGKIFIIPTKSKRPISSFTSLSKIVKSNNYQYVMRVSAHSLSTLDLLAARMGGAKRLIMRSTNSSSGSLILNALHKMFIFLPKVIPNLRVAPSKTAAEYSFGKNCIKDHKALILHNGLYLQQYQYNPKKREQLRNDLNIHNKIVIGHVGRFAKQKNHSFLLDIFYEFHKDNADSVLLLIGDGELRTSIEEKVSLLGIKRNVLFLGVRKDVSSLLNAIDIFVFPSLFEGMPNAVLEAQTNGLPCIVSDTITDEVKLTDLVERVSLASSAIEWKNECLELYSRTKNRDRLSYSERMKINGYDINDVVKQYEEIVFEA